MKIIEGLKKIKDLQRKAEDLRIKVKNNCAHLSFETPKYTDQKGQISKWIQAHSDILQEISRLRIAIQTTNLKVMVIIDLDGQLIKKSIAAWIHRRRDLSKQEVLMWKQLTDRGLKEGKMPQSTGDVLEVKIVRCYDPLNRDVNIDLYTSEALVIDSKLEVVNAITTLIEETGM